MRRAKARKAKEVGHTPSLPPLLCASPGSVPNNAVGVASLLASPLFVDYSPCVEYGGLRSGKLTIPRLLIIVLALFSLARTIIL